MIQKCIDELSAMLMTVCFISLHQHGSVNCSFSLSVSSLTAALSGPAQSDVIGDHVEVVPGVQLPLGMVVVHHAVVTVLVLEGHGDSPPHAGGRVKHIVDGGVGRGVAGHCVQASAHHESIGHCVLPDVGLPALHHFQALGVQLGDHDCALGLARAVDSPQALLVCRQVDVGVAAPGVRVLAMVAGVRQVKARGKAL